MALQDLKHFKEILSPTPSGTEKLLAAWDDLSIETQIEILFLLQEIRYPTYLIKKIYLKAVSSANPYIRYLAVRPPTFIGERNLRSILSKEEFEEIENKIFGSSSFEFKNDLDEYKKSGDPSSLVRYSNFDFNGTTDDFYNLSQPARLAISQKWTSANDEVIEIIENAYTYIEKGIITSSEVIEIFENYFGGPKFSGKYKGPMPLDGWLAYLQGEELEKLWLLLLKIPKELHLPLLEHLPVESGLGSMPEGIPNQLYGNSLDYLLMRDDVVLSDLRKKIFFDKTKEKHHFWAVSNNFNLDFNEFYNLLPKYKYEINNNTDEVQIIWDSEDDEIKSKLNDLQYANDLHWVYLHCIKDYACSSSERDLYDIHAINDTLKRCYNAALNKSLPDYYIENQLLMIKLYMLASKVTPWHKHKIDDKFEIYSQNGELNFLKKVIISNDRWKTFMAFLKEWKQKRDNVSLFKYLPKVDDLEEELEEEIEKEDQFEDLSSETISNTLTNIRLLNDSSLNHVALKNELLSINVKFSKLEIRLTKIIYILIGIGTLLIWKLF